MFVRFLLVSSHDPWEKSSIYSLIACQSRSCLSVLAYSRSLVCLMAPSSCRDCWFPTFDEIATKFFLRYCEGSAIVVTCLGFQCLLYVRTSPRKLFGLVMFSLTLLSHSVSLALQEPLELPKAQLHHPHTYSSFDDNTQSAHDFCNAKAFATQTNDVPGDLIDHRFLWRPHLFFRGCVCGFVFAFGCNITKS